MGDWLWDGAGEPDPATAEIVRALSPLGYRGGPPRLPRQRWRAALVAGPVAAALAAAALLAVWASGGGGPGWSCGEGCKLEPGEWLLTRDAAVELAVADIGTMAVAPDSRLRLVATSAARHQLELARGSVHARVVAPPRLLVVDTPAASAVDLGCEYDLTVLDDGSSLLVVTSGEVSLEAGGAVSYVPEDAAALGWPGHGPGIPWFDDAPTEYADALVAWERDGERQRLPEILAASRPRDTLSLWHLLQRADADERERVLARVVALCPEAARLDPEALVALDAAALAELRDVLAERWWP